MANFWDPPLKNSLKTSLELLRAALTSARRWANNITMPSRLCAPVGAASGGNGKHQEKSRSNIGSVDAAARKSSKLTSQGPPGDGTRAAARRRSNIDRHGCGPSCALTVESRGIGWEAMVCLAPDRGGTKERATRDSTASGGGGG